MFMDDSLLLGKNYNQIDMLVQTVHMLSREKRIELGLPNYGVFIFERGERQPRRMEQFSLVDTK